MTIVDVAKLAGVSTSTVSHVLNGTRPVRTPTRRRVVEAVEATGYRQDALARAMRRSRTDSIGIVVSDVGEPAFAEMVHGVEQAAVEHHLTLLLANSAEDPDCEFRAARALLERRVDGLVIARCADSSPALTRYLLGADSPTVLLDRMDDAAPFDQVGADNRESMSRLVRQLQRAGHTRFLLVVGDTRVPTLRERRDGFFDAVRDAEGDQVVVAEHDPALLHDAIKRALRGSVRSCIIAGSTPLAVAVLTCLRDVGQAVPSDVAFATYDGFAHSDLFSPSVTTVHSPAFEMGRAAVGMLIERLASPEAVPRTLRLRQTLELGSSTTGYRCGGRAS